MDYEKTLGITELASIQRAIADAEALNKAVKALGISEPSGIQRTIADAEALKRATVPLDVARAQEQLRQLAPSIEQLKNQVGLAADGLLKERERIAEQLRPFKGIGNDLFLAWQRALREYQPLENLVAQVRASQPLEQLRDQARALQQAAGLRAFVSNADELFRTLQHDWYQSSAAKAFDALRAFRLPEVDWDALLERDSRTLAFAASDGWFVQPENDIGLAVEIDECGGDVGALEQLFVTVMEPELEAISERVFNAFPARKHIVSEAFALYKEGRYLAAIPLFLSTADGIAHENSGKSAFSVSGKQTTLSEWVRKQGVQLALQPYLDQLAATHSLARSRHGKLSRHDVQHGISLDHGTKANCLRAISFMGYIAWLMAKGSPDQTGQAS